MRIKRRMLSMLLSVVMMLSLLPATALAATAPDVYDVKVMNKAFTSAMTEIPCGSGTATYDPDTRTLTLDSVEMDLPNLIDGSAAQAITSEGDLTVVVKGNSTIVSPNKGIYAKGKLVLSGDCSINIQSQLAPVWSDEEVVIDNTGEIILTSTMSAGIYAANGNISITGKGKLEIDAEAEGIKAENGEVTISGKDEVSILADADGIKAGQKIVLSDNAKVSIKSTGDYITTSDNEGYGIYALSGGVTLSNSEEVTIDAELEGISATGSVTLSGNEEVTIKSKLDGIVATGAIEISSAVDITTNNVYAIKARNDIVIADGYLLTEPTNAEVATIDMGQQATMVTVMDKDASAFAKHVVIVECKHLNTEIVDKKDATCTVDGYTGDTICKDCEVTVVEGDVIKAAHKEVVDKAVDATCDKAGKTEGKHCSVCAEVLAAQKEVPAKGHADLNLDGKCDECAGDMTVTYTMKSGDNSEWTKGSKEGLLFVSTAEFSVFKAVKVDGVEIAATNYSAKSGSTEVLLKTTYLETLAVGAHTLAIVSSNGVATAKFVVKEKPADKTPETGDSMNVLAILGIAMLSALVIGYVSFKKREIQ